MLKKIIILFLFILQYSIFSMDIDYASFFDDCKHEKLKEIEQFAQQAQVNINYQNEHGETALVYATSWRAHKSIDLLLTVPGINIHIKDNYGQSFFSKSMRTESSCVFINKILHLYSPEEINAECKNISLWRNTEYVIVPEVNQLITDALIGNCPDAMNAEYTAFVLANNHQHLTCSIQLLKKYPFLGKHNYALNQNCQKVEIDPEYSFVVREAFNNGSIAPVSPLICFCFNIVSSENEMLLKDITSLILKTYIELLVDDMTDDIMKKEPTNVEALLWQPLCKRLNFFSALTKKEIKDEKQCLLWILTRSQEEKTKLNLEMLKSQLMQ